MKKPVLLLISYYFGLFVFAFTLFLLYLNFSKSVDSNILLAFLISGICIWVILFLLGVTLNIISIIYSLKNNQINNIVNSMKILKYGSIPFYILNFTVSTLFCLLFVFASRGLGIIVVPIPIFITWIILLSTSINTLVLLVILFKKKTITKKYFVIGIICQLTFIIDIFSTISIAKKCKKAAIT
jgi:hypothetical protein